MRLSYHDRRGRGTRALARELALAKAYLMIIVPGETETPRR
jgi:hypothetical protein